MITNQPLPIFHLTPAAYYQRQPVDQPYQPAALAQEGFIHCTAGVDKLIQVANYYFADLRDDLLVLEIDSAQLTAPLIFEPPVLAVSGPVGRERNYAADPQTLFPHVYGPLNRQAIRRCFALQRDSTGQWQLPQATADG
ncbi:MAG: DUF952 domain-containing protein [Anaerolineae bacterium]